jgi:hypothetical protein
MAIGSTKDTLGTGARDRIAGAYAKHLIPSGPPSLVVEALQDRLRDAKDQEVWRIAMMIGYFDEDAGEL